MLSVTILFCLILAWTGRYFRLLTTSGAVLTMLVGSGVSFGFGLKGLVVLLLFFGSSSLLSKIGRSRKKSVDAIVEKEGARDGWQVLANGGVAFVAAIAYAMTMNFAYLLLFLFVIAASNADTWASEIGPLSRRDPWSLKTLRRVPAGTSGAMSLIGTLGTIAGAAFIALAAQWIFSLSLTEALLVTGIGVLGSLLDTLFGAMWQRVYECSVCGERTEKREHHGQPTAYVSGIWFLGNDAVNVMTSGLASGIGFIIVRFW
ncbi:DUF92 domain-containing protein [Exiguobacterium acetylicum]|uniref:DUF92 domain-containing protein n=1 Tax=Exiguobacterium TaxID=33986 RepID=UPI0006FD0666|nr:MULTISPECIES: DUF92 domain-containing protein [Exiguobacterium]KQS44741.1 hypothetical protein ASG02_01510 [Exiguobacterium sp. Leaf196]MDQ6466054.1 DUF92 domain-containing protein [Exiguobacterium acetylicum]HAB33202.1 DUF92 domain-containing protein [Exiguobacterium sp.]